MAKKKELGDPNRRLIFGVGVQINHPDVVKIKSEADVKAWGGFDHLSEEDQKEATKQLLEALNPKEVKKDATIAGSIADASLTKKPEDKKL